MSLLQNEDFKTEAQITGAGGTASQLLNDSKIWVTGNSINKTLDDAIIDGDIGGGGGGINFITNFKAASNTTGWNTGSDGAAVPVDGTGGAFVGTFSRSTVSPLEGSASFLYEKPASNALGSFMATDFSIYSAYQGKMLQIRFPYEIPSNDPDYLDGHMRVYIYDVTNGVVIEPSQRDILANAVRGEYIGYFQAASNSTSYRLILIVATSTTTAWNFKFDLVNVGPISSGNAGTFISDWQPWTPASSQGLGTISAVNFVYRRVGSNIEIQGTLTTGTLTAVQARLDLPTGIIPNVLTTTPIVAGVWYLNSGAGSDLKQGTVLVNNSTSYLTFATSEYVLGASPLGAEAATVLFNSSTILRFSCTFPVQGWSTGVSASEISSVSAISMRASGGTTNFTGATTLIFPTKETDTAGAYNSANGEFTIPESGFFVANALVRVNAITLSTSQSISVLIYRNAVELGGSTKYGNGASITYRVNASVSFYANKGDIITVKGSSSVSSTMNGGASDNFFTISKVSTPAQIAPTEFVGCSYNTDSGQTFSDGATVVYEDKIYDSHNAYNSSTGDYIIPVSGKYLFAGQIFTTPVASTVGENIMLYVSKNTVRVNDGVRDVSQNTTARNFSSNVIAVIDCVKGDLMRFVADESFATNRIAQTSTRNYMTITKVS